MRLVKSTLVLSVPLAMVLSTNCSFDGFSQASPRYDTLIKNGRIIDGTGNPWYRGAVGIRDERIAAIGDLDDAEATRVLDARGRVVCPGFIDMMGTSDWELLVDARAASKITQGITLMVSGEGHSVAPASDRYLEARQARFSRFGITPDWRTLDDFFSRLEANPPSVNFATYVGTGGLREIVIGRENRSATQKELVEMKRLAAEAMEDGALGICSALMYIPDRYNSMEELIALARVASRYGGIYATHQRSEGDAIEQSLNEVFTIAREADLPAEIFHLKTMYRQNWGKMPEVIARIEAARQAGLQITADVYPYDRAAGGLSAMLPNWVNEGGHDERAARLRDPNLRERIKKELETSTPEWENEYYGAGGASGFLIIRVGNEAMEDYVGRTLADIAEELDEDPRDVFMDIVLAGDAGIVTEIMDEADVKLALEQPWTSFNTDSGVAAPDGALSGHLVHPRAYGSFPRVLGRYVRDQDLMRLAEAIRKATSLPAQTLRIRDRGLVREGFYADLVIFDPETIMDKATYQDPHQYSQGIDYVFVNGEAVVAEGQITDARPGMVVRGPGYQAKP